MNRHLKIVLLLFISTCTLLSQWVRTNGPNSQFIYSLHLRGNAIFTGTSDGVYRSTDNGLTWLLINNGLYTGDIRVTSIVDLYDKLFIGTDSGIYVSSNNGDLWVQKVNGLNTYGSRFINSLFIYNSLLIFAGTEDGIFVSSDEGESWLAENNGLDSMSVYSFTSRANKIFAGSESKVYISTNSGENWVSSYLGLSSSFSVLTLATNGTNVVAGLCCGGGVYVTANDGSSWQLISQISVANTFVRLDEKIIGGTANGVLISSNGGYNWTEYNEGLQYLNTTAIDYNSTVIYAGIENYVWRRPVGEITNVQPYSGEIPGKFVLYQNYPNPFNPSTKIKFDIPESGKGLSHVKLVLFDVQGREIAVLLNKMIQAGRYEILWDAAAYPSGIYFYKLTAGHYTGTGKMILIK